METFKDIPVNHFYHQVDLPDGSSTPGICSPVRLAAVYGLDKVDFKDKKVLDVGTWNGGWAFYAESRGAAAVTGVDRIICRPGGTEGFDLIKTALQSKVAYHEVNAYNLWHAFPQKSYDIVFCFGILYHLSDPAFALQNCVHAARELIVVETVAKKDDAAYVELLPPGEYFGDATNITCPTTGWLRTTMHHFGWKCIKEVTTLHELSKGRCRVAMHFSPISDDVLPPTWSWIVFPHPQAN